MNRRLSTPLMPIAVALCLVAAACAGSTESEDSSGDASATTTPTSEPDGADDPENASSTTTASDVPVVTTSTSEPTVADDAPTTAAAETPGAAEVVLVNGRIYTADDEGTWAEAVAISNGDFVYVGSDAEAATYVGDDTEFHDLQGQLVVPGLIDAHTHPGLVSILGGDEELLIPTTSLEDIQAWLGEYAAETDDFLLTASSWPNALFGPGEPRKDWLDEVVPDRPVVLFDQSGHSQWANSALFDILGITADTPDPAPGLSEFVRDENGEPTGVIREFALADVAGPLFLPEDEDLHRELERFIEFLADHGITALMDAGNLGFHDNVYGHLANLESQDELPLRYEGAYHVYRLDQIDVAIDEVNRLRADYGGELLTFNTIKIHYDGALEVGTGATLESYANQPGTGATLFPTEEITELLVQMQGERMHLHLHNVGDRAVKNALDAVEAAQAEVGGPLDTQVTLSHIEIIDPADIERFVELGVLANYTPHWQGEYGHEISGTAANLGPEREAGKFPARELEDAGVIVTYSSDVIEIPESWRANPYFGIQIGHLRQEPGIDNAPIVGGAAATLTIEQLINGYTRNAAIQLGQDENYGSIEVNKTADLVVLDQNIFTIDPTLISETTPTAIIIAGTVTRGELT
jgi:predicted amidohydrolase YtcJ